MLVACFDTVALRPELRAPATQHDAVGLADALERMVDEGRATPDDREAAYEAICSWTDTSVEYAFARASLAGRLAQVRGVTAVGLVREMEHWGREALRLDPRWRDGAPKRLLGTMYVLVPGKLVRHGTSEEGLELLEAQTRDFPGDPVNHLRLAEAYVTLDDVEPATEHLCFALARSKSLKASDASLLASLVEQAGGRTSLDCGRSGELAP